MHKLYVTEKMFDSLLIDTFLTIRKGFRPIEEGPLELASNETCRSIVVRATEVYQCPLVDVDAEDLQVEGYDNWKDALSSLQQHYPNMDSESMVTVVKFKNL